jgi:hypothetical protein
MSIFGLWDRRLTLTLSDLTDDVISQAVRVCPRGVNAWKFPAIVVGVVAFINLTSGRGPGAWALGLVLYLAFAWLWTVAVRLALTRRRQLPVLGASAVVGVSSSTVYVASVNPWTGSAARILGSWNRDEVGVRQGRQRRGVRQLSLEFTDGTILQLETSSRAKVDEIAEPVPQPAPALPPQGWYADPESPNGIRYWDGQGWTDRSIAEPWSGTLPQTSS